MTGVYFLTFRNKVVYVGKTTRWPVRLSEHRGGSIRFTDHRFIACSESLLDSYEKRWILKFRPKYNKRMLHRIYGWRNSFTKIDLTPMYFIDLGEHLKKDNAQTL